MPSYVKSVKLSRLFAESTSDDEVVLLSSTEEQPEDAAQLNAVVNTAIAANPGATRAALQVGNDPTKFNPGTITRLVYAGDSITANQLTLADGNGDITQNSKLWAWWTQMVSGREFTYSKRIIASPYAEWQTFAASGNKVENFISTWLPQILALDPKPSHCVMQYGTNDCANPLDQYIADYATAIDSLRAGGVEPIVMTPPPANAYSGYSAGGLDLDDRVLNATRGSVIAEFTSALIELCVEKGVAMIDNRPFGEIPNNPGEAPRGTHQEGDLGGIHPWDGWHHAIAQNIASRLLAWGAAGDDILSTGTVVNDRSDFSVAAPTITNGANQTTTAQLVSRSDGIAGNLLEVYLENNGTKQIGSGDTGVLFTPKAGYTAKDFEVCIITQSGYKGVGGTDASPTTTPAVAVERILGTSRLAILVKPARPVSTFTSTCQEVIDAVNAHAIASTILTATSTGTAGSNVWPAGNNGTTMPTCSFNTYIPGTPTAAEGLISDTDEMRFAVEVWHPKGAVFPGLNLNGYAWNGSSYATYDGSISRFVSDSNPNAVRIQPGRSVYFTPWVTVGNRRRLHATVTFGGAEGVYRFGRAQVQVRTP